MKKASRVLLIAAGTLLAFCGAVLLAVNLYVQSQGTQARIQEELTQRLGATLQIQRISITPWSGLKLTGIAMPQEKGNLQRDFLRADTFRLRIRFLSLFSRQLVITEVLLVNPSVVWAQNENGKWRLPVTAKQPAPELSTPVPHPAEAAVEKAAPTTRISPLPAMQSTAPPAPAGPVESEQPAEATFTPEVRRVSLRNGNFHFLDSKAKPVATFEKVNFKSNLRNGSALRGNASIAKISLRDRFFLEQLESPVNYDAVALSFSKITARAAGGDVTGHFAMDPADPGSPFQVHVKFHDVEADRVVIDAGGPAGMVAGRIDGELSASGKTAEANALSGAGQIHLRDAQVRQYSLLVALGQLLQIDELTQLKFDEAQVKYRIQPGTVTIDELVLASPNIRLSGQGTISFDGKLRIESQLAISEKIRGQLFSGIRENFQPADIPGYTAVNFQVSGTVERPKTNLMNKVVGGQLKDLGGVINSLLGGEKSNRAKGKKPAAEPAGAAPTAAPQPSNGEAGLPREEPLKPMESPDAPPAP